MNYICQCLAMSGQWFHPSWHWNLRRYRSWHKSALLDYFNFFSLPLGSKEKTIDQGLAFLFFLFERRALLTSSNKSIVVLPVSSTECVASSGCFYPFPSKDKLVKRPYRKRLASRNQGLTYRPVQPNRRSPVPVYRSGLAGNRSEPIKFKFEFKSCRAIGSDRLTGRLDQFTGRFTGRFDW